MSRNKRKTTALQAIAVTTVCLLFVTTALVGLYKCFSQEPAPKDRLKIGRASCRERV